MCILDFLYKPHLATRGSYDSSVATGKLKLDDGASKTIRPTHKPWVFPNPSRTPRRPLMQVLSIRCSMCPYNVIIKLCSRMPVASLSKCPPRIQCDQVRLSCLHFSNFKQCCRESRSLCLLASACSSAQNPHRLVGAHSSSCRSTYSVNLCTRSQHCEPETRRLCPGDRDR
jgi:hypothetical protein